MPSRYPANKLYLVSHKFKHTTGGWAEEAIIVFGAAMRSRGYDLEPHTEHTPKPHARYELHDGHLPKYRPIVYGSQLYAAMASMGAYAHATPLSMGEGHDAG